MKKLVFAVAAFCAATVVNAAAVGWSCAGLNSFAGNAYDFFVVGQNGATDIATVTALLDAGKDVSGYAFASGEVSSAGLAAVAFGKSGLSLNPSETTEYSSFFVVFDSTEPKAGDSKYLVVSASGLNKSVGPTSANVTFAAGNQGVLAGDTANWKSFGTGGGVPEPTSGLLLALGLAGLALRRKQK